MIDPIELELLLAFWGRVSTEDNQDPESSRGWQITRAKVRIKVARTCPGRDGDRYPLIAAQSQAPIPCRS